MLFNTFEELDGKFEKTTSNRTTSYKITDKISVKKISRPTEKYFIIIMGLAVEVDKNKLILQLTTTLTSELLTFQSEVSSKIEILNNAMFKLNGHTYK